MNFLIDAQLPRRLAYRLRDFGHDVVHTLDLPRRNRTPDAEIKELSLREKRVVITKDGNLSIPSSFKAYPTNCYWFQRVTSRMPIWKNYSCRILSRWLKHLNCIVSLRLIVRQLQFIYKLRLN